MTSDPTLALRDAFRGRPRPSKWLCDELHPLDREDGSEFIADIERGASPAKYFLSAIPYASFLTLEAGVYLLPDYLASIVTESTQVVDVLCHLQSQYGWPVIEALTEEERVAVVRFLEVIEKTEEVAWMKDPLSELKELIQNRPTSYQPPTPTSDTPAAGAPFAPPPDAAGR